MRCERAQELFSDVHEGAAPRAVLVPFENHLAECTACRAQMDGLREVWNLLDSAPMVEPPADFRAAVWKRIDAAEAAKQKAHPLRALALDWRTLFSRPAAAWAAAALLLVLLTGVVVPGRYTAARMVFPWSLFYSAPKTQVAVIGEPRVIDSADGKRTLDIPVNNPGPGEVHATVLISSGPVLQDRGAFNAGQGTNAWFGVIYLRPDAGSEPIRGRITWTQNGETHTKDFTVPTPTR